MYLVPNGQSRDSFISMTVDFLACFASVKARRASSTVRTVYPIAPYPSATVAQSDPASRLLIVADENYRVVRPQ